MKDFYSILLRAVVTFAAFAVVQYIIPYYLLVIGGLGAGFLLLKTGDRAVAIGTLVGSGLFGVFAYAMSQIYPITG